MPELPADRQYQCCLDTHERLGSQFSPDPPLMLKRTSSGLALEETGRLDDAIPAYREAALLYRGLGDQPPRPE